MRTSLRWAVPAAVVGGITASVLVAPQLASADPELPPTTAADLLVKVATAQQQPFSGTVVQSTDLGLPLLPTGAEPSAVTSLLAGDTTLRVWWDGPERFRVAVTGREESDVVRDGRDLWTWESGGNTASHATLPEGSAESQPTPQALPDGQTPALLAEQALAMISPSTEVTLDGTASVADRDAYELVLEPRDAGSLVGEVRLAVDSVTSLPLRVQVTARGADEPAYEVGFTAVSFDTPGDEVFRFTPPSGAVVTERGSGELPADPGPQDGGHEDGGHEDGGHEDGGHEDATGTPGAGDEGAPVVVGQDWTSVVVLHGVDPAQVSEATADDELATALLGGFEPTSGPYGTGRLMTTALVSALWLDDGRLLVGPVTPQVLEKAAADPAAAVAPAPVP